MNRSDLLIEADELLSKINDPNLRIFDATIQFFPKEGEPNAHDNYLTEHIPGAAFYDHQAFSNPNQAKLFMVLSEAELATQMGQVGISNDSEVVVYAADLLPCATRAWWVLTYAGHTNVRVLNGGLSAWKKAGGPVASGAERYPPTTFVPNIQAEMMASKEEVLAAMNNGAVCTVNTLNQEMYDKGHIAGSTLLPCMDLMVEMATFRPDEEIAAHLAQERGYERVITYCGGGFAATVNGMGHLLAGNPNVSVYDGSMNEWTAEKLPLNKAAA